MTPRFLLGAAIGVFLAAPCTAAGPVLVELFTSQGCSDCPAADHLLSTWGLEGFRSGTILPLSFNVDYWNYLGWTDVFSTPRWSQRQARYAQALQDRTYTPQMVVAGRESFVGSDGERARQAVERYSNEPARARIELKSSPAAKVSIEVSVIPKVAQAAGMHVMLAFFELGLVTEVTSGENNGRTLRNDFVVRKLIDLGALESGKTFRRRVQEPWDDSWKKSNSGAAVFLQDPDTLAVFDARTFSLSK